MNADAPGHAHVDLLWLPLGAGGHSVRLNGRVYEWLSARLARREPRDLYHTALEIRTPEGRFVIEQGPAGGRDGSERGVVAEGPVASRRLARWRLFRYEVRCWRDGVVPDANAAIDSPRRVTEDVGVASRLLELVPHVPTLTWGRDESATGDMWNSNSVTAWLLVRSGADVAGIRPPAGGRAPGWEAGIAVARRAGEREIRRNPAPERDFRGGGQIAGGASSTRLPGRSR